jgi:hypothetical protein
MEERESLCPDHLGTVIHLAGSGEGRRFIVEVKLAQGSFYIESPCTYTPAMGMDSLDGHLANDAEEWLLVQRLRVKPRRLPKVFGSADRLMASEYVQRVSNIRVSEDAEYEFEEGIPLQKVTVDSVADGAASPAQQAPAAPAMKKWWQFWR